jgi:hypothetical protein
MGRKRRAALVLAGGAVATVAAGCHLGMPRRTVDVAATAVATGDLNGDGVPDLATVGGGTVAVHLSDGAGSVETTTYVNEDPTGSTYYSGVEILDGDADGDLDVAVVQYYERVGGADLRLWPNEGTGALGDGVAWGGGAFVRGMAVGDVDGDGADDLAVTDEYATRVSSGNGGGPATVVELPDSGGWAVEMADLNGDGLEDVMAGRSPVLPGGPPGPSVTVFLATAGGFSPPVLYPTGSSLPLPDSLRAGDMDGDGRLDLVVGSTDADSRPGEVSVLLGAGGGAFGPALVADAFPSNDATDLEVADLDTDGWLDVVVSGTHVLFGDGAGGFADDHSILAGGDGAVADLDGDGVMDVAAARPVLYLFLNRLDGARDHD